MIESGCRRVEPPVPPVASTSAAAVDAAAGNSGTPTQPPTKETTSASDWRAQLQRLSDRIQRDRPSVGWPAPAGPPRNRPSAGQPEGTGFLIRLLDQFNSAERESSWTAPASSDAALTTFKSASLREPGAGARVFESRNAGGEVAWLELSGFDVPRERIGRITLEARFGAAREFTLAWAERAGSITLPAGQPGEWQPYTIATDDFSRWQGPLNWLRVGVRKTNVTGSPEIEIRNLTLHPRSAAYPEPIGMSRATLSKHLRSALYLHGSSRVRFGGLTLPSGARLAWGGAVAGGAGRLRVTVEQGMARRVLFEQALEQAETWRDEAVDPALATGESVALIFESLDAAAGSVLLVADPVLYAPRPDPPRVVLYLIDTMGAMHLSLYGYDRPTTPRIEALAREGVYFSHMASNASRTVESIPNLMLSMSTLTHQIRSENDRAPPAAETLAERFAAAGYATACFSTNVNAGPRQGMEQGFDSFFDHISAATPGDPRTIPLEEVLGWMEAHRDRPQFVYIHTAEPHDPYEPPEPFRGRFGAAGQPADSHGVGISSLYDGEIAFADFQFGRFMDGVRQRGLEQGLLLALTADHGEAFGEHGSYKHGQNVFAELVRVPLILWSPGRIAPRGAIDGLAQILDLYPTLLDYAGLEPAPAVQGQSLRPAIEDRAPPRYAERAILIEAYMPRPNQRALLAVGWKLVHLPARRTHGGFLLFDTAADSGDERDLLADHPEIALRLAQTLAAMVERLPRYRSDAPPTPFTSEQSKALIRMGYLVDSEEESPPASSRP